MAFALDVSFRTNIVGHASRMRPADRWQALIGSNAFDYCDFTVARDPRATGWILVRVPEGEAPRAMVPLVLHLAVVHLHETGEPLAAAALPP